MMRMTISTPINEFNELKTSFIATPLSHLVTVAVLIPTSTAIQNAEPEVRAGLQTGKCGVRGDDIGGIAVIIGARVSAPTGRNDSLSPG